MNQFLANVWYLKELKLGPNFSFVGWNNWSSNPYPVNLVDPSGMYGFHSSYYTGYWQNVGTGTVEAPYGENILKSQELVLTYDEQRWRTPMCGSLGLLKAHQSLSIT